MNYINAIIFGAIQGLTEFLPVSSSGHLVILHEFLVIPISNELVFDVLLHFATLLAVLCFFRKDIWTLFLAWLQTFRKRGGDYGRVAWLILLGTIPAGFFGFFFEDIIENSLRSPLVVVFMLVAVGVLFLFVEKFAVQRKELKEVSFKQALVVGFAQALALIPGTSRSGITIIAGMFTNLKREEAVRFSFLLSIPVITGAVLTKVSDLFSNNMETGELGVVLVAFFSALIFGILTIKYFLIFAKKYSLKLFAYYRFVLAFLLSCYLFM
jgi:undecaprenyl-diphosphatase